MANFFKEPNKKQVSNQPIKLTVQRISANGHGVSKFGGKPVFIPGVLLGEKVLVKTVEKKHKYIKAQLLEVIQPSEERVIPKCDHFLKCDLQVFPYEQQLTLKQRKVEELFNRQNIQNLPWQPATLSTPYHYRRKARIGVQFNKKGESIVGFRKEDSNQITAIKSCPVLLEPMQDIFRPLKQTIDRLSLGKSIGHVEVIYTDKITLVIRQLKKLNDNDRAIWIEAEIENKWKILINDGDSITSITPESPQDSMLRYFIQQNIKLAFSPSDFIQVNERVNDQMITKAIEWLALNAQDSVLDLFCGLGNFSLPIAQKVRKLTGVEGVQEMVDRAAENAKQNSLANCAFHQANLNAPWLECEWAKESFTKVILDPARAGAYEAVQQLIQLKVETILYVSCDASTLAKDCKVLIDAGYHIKKIMLMDMFSQTKHVETMVLFERI